jgi:hypothetical protein
MPTANVVDLAIDKGSDDNDDCDDGDGDGGRHPPVVPP